MILDLEVFLARERPRWEELEQALRPFEQDRFYRPSLEDALRLFDLYEHCVAALARFEESSQPELSAYLESLVARAYAQIHSVSKGGRFRPFEWLMQTVPVTFRRRSRAFIVATAMFILGSITGVSLLKLDADAKAVLMPFPHLLTDPNERVKMEQEDRGRRLSGHQVAFSAYLMTHNIGVAFMSMAAGMTFGIGTTLMLFSNGVDLGAVCADYMHAGQTRFLLGWLLPHGLVEIPALLIAAQAGLLLASALIGWQSRVARAQRLREVSPDVVTLSVAAAIMLVWAGLIESFLSQYHEPVISYEAKIAFAVLEFLLLVWFFARRWRRPDSSSASSIHR